MDYKYDEREPYNSWEVSYIVSIRRPYIKLGITKKELDKIVPDYRKRMIKSWAREFFTQEWFLAAMNIKPRPSMQLYNRHPYF
jgi:hypothetical protein